MNEKPFEDMNVIPFVDIMLVLLTIVLITSSFIVSGRIPVNLPEASKQAAQADTTVTIELGKAGDIYLNGKAVTVDSLKGNLAPLGRETGFLVRADRDVALQRFIDVVDLLKQMQFQKVAVQTKNRS